MQKLGKPRALPVLLCALPKTGTRLGSANDATATGRGDCGVSPMWIAAQGRHTGVSSGSHRGYIRTAGQGGGVIAGVLVTHDFLPVEHL